MPTSLDRYLLQGGYPAVHARGLDTQRYYADYVASYVERDMQSHYARGALFETWAVTEALKWRAVRGNAQPLYFWRDNIGNEVDPQRGPVQR